MRSITSALAILFFILAIGYWYIGRPADDATWDVVLMGFPTSISTQQLEVMSVGYIIHQTHKPLFSRDSDGHFGSQVLSKWLQSRDGHSIELCPNAEAKIGRSSAFTASRLAEFLVNRFHELEISASVSVSTHCVNIKLAREISNFFEIFTRFENAPTWRNETAFDDGLGDFYISKFTPDQQMTLERKEEKSGGFQKIEVHAYKTKDEFERLVKTGGIEDINRISPDLVPDFIKKIYSDYGVVLLHTGVLLINLKNPHLREAVYNCLDIDKFRHAFSPTQEHFKNIQTILPVGAPGAKEGMSEQHCKPVASNRVRFWNWKDNNRAQIKRYFEDFAEMSGISVDYSDIPLSKLMDVVSRKIKDYDLMVVGLSATEFHYRDFYQYLVDPHFSMISAVKIDLSQQIAELDADLNQPDLLSKINKVDKAIADARIALPLFQQTRHFYFPRNVKGLKFGANSLEYPVVGELSK